MRENSGGERKSGRIVNTDSLKREMQGFMGVKITMSDRSTVAAIAVATDGTSACLASNK